MGLPRVVIVALLLVGAAAACSGGGDEGEVAADVRPFAEVQDGDMTFEADPTDPSRAIFRVTTTEPMICAIVWGEDDSYGRFNNSLAMSGTGIVQHDVVLPGAESGVEYHFVVQGTTADGTLHRSEPGTFTIERDDSGVAATPDVEVGENLALGAEVVAVSSEFSDGFSAENALDDDGATEWGTSGDGDDAHIEVDLGAERQIGAVELLTRSMADGSAIIETYTVRVDGGEPLGPFAAGDLAEREIAPVDATGRRVRVDVESSTGGNVGAVEIRVYAPPG